MEHKRTFWEYFDRTTQLDFRAMKVRTLWFVFSQFNPVKAPFVRKRFNKTLKLIHEMKISESKKGYWM